MTVEAQREAFPNPSHMQKSKRAGRLAGLGLAVFVATEGIVSSQPTLASELTPEANRTIPTQTAEVTLLHQSPPAKSQIFEASASSEVTQDALGRTLTDFLAGKIKLKSSEKFIYAEKTPARLNIQQIDLNFLKKDNPSALYQAVLLGEEIVDNHVIVYAGFQDAKGKYFFIPINYGDITNEQYKRFFMKSGKEVFPTGNITGYGLNIRDTYDLLQKHNRQAILINLYPDAKFPSPPPEGAYANSDEFNAQGKTTDKFVRWSFATTKKPYAKVSMSPEVKKIVNKRMKSFDAKSIPAGFQISLFGDK